MTPTPPESPDQGPEHNPDNLSPEQYGWPIYRLLKESEDPITGDGVISPDKTYWLSLGDGFLPGKRKDRTYRRRVAPEPEQTSEPCSTGDVAETIERNPKSWAAWKREAERLGRRIAELERENDQLALIGSEAVQLLRDWLIGSECFCTPEGCASRQPCSFCKTTAFIAAGDSNNDDPYELTVESYRADRDRLAEENAQLERERDEARAELEKVWITHGELRESSEHLKDQLAASEKDRQWQPIETAPKDGTRVMIYTPDMMGAVETGFYHEFTIPPGWCADTRGKPRSPTHWMPLPKAPDAAMKEAQ